MDLRKEKSEKMWWETIRKHELSTAFTLFPNKKNLEMLEIGGRDGFQAQIISKEGFKVTSIDINPIYPQIYPVKKGDITNLDFQDDTFDIIYSSNMLQEIVDIEKAFLEMKRVLKKDGIIIHVVPSSWWSIITNFFHYCFIPKYLIKSNRFQKMFNYKKNNTNNSNQDKNVTTLQKNNLKKLFFHPLGDNASFLHEIYFFSKFYWKKLFEQNGFKIMKKKNCPYFYSGYAVFKFKFVSIRKFLAKIYFPSCYCFVMKNDS